MVPVSVCDLASQMLLHWRPLHCSTLTRIVEAHDTARIWCRRRQVECRICVNGRGEQ